MLRGIEGRRLLELVEVVVEESSSKINPPVNCDRWVVSLKADSEGEVVSGFMVPERPILDKLFMESLSMVSLLHQLRQPEEI